MLHILLLEILLFISIVLCQLASVGNFMPKQVFYVHIALVLSMYREHFTLEKNSFHRNVGYYILLINNTVRPYLLCVI